ncbi:MAG TPA: response regulator, partial [Castellaniella sp.]|nr:response regulator [Castellaniella sp.]
MPHVLVIDDDALVRETLAEVARDCGYSVAEVDTIRDAMLQLDMQPPDLVLADLGLPDGDGIDVCRSAAALGAEIVVI